MIGGDQPPFIATFQPTLHSFSVIEQGAPPLLRGGQRKQGAGMTGKSYAYWAVIEHVQGMIGNDGRYLEEIKAAKGQLTPDLARRITRDFGVARNIQKVLDDDDMPVDGIHHLISDLHDLAATWPTDLVTQAKQCVTLAEVHRGKQQARKDKYPKPPPADGGKRKKPKAMAPYSGVTKLMWFLKPKGWTMFDSLAQKGLGTEGKAGENVVAFYQALEDRSFDAKRKEIEELCRKSGFDWIYAERVIDKFLLFRGSDMTPKRKTYFEWAQKQGGHFLSSIKREAPDFYRKLHGLAEAMAGPLPDHSFLIVQSEV